MSSPSAGAYTVVIPVKPPAVGKSRLRGVEDDVRRALVVAFALDTASAALSATSVGSVLAVTDDHLLAARLRALGCSVIPDGITAHLNGTLRLAAAEADRRTPGAPVAALCGDLPSLRPDELDLALATAEPSRPSFVTDRAGTGTVLLMAPHPGAFDPHFGHASRAAHLAAGALELAVVAPGLRHDVDTHSDLLAAVTRGVGEHTALVLASRASGRSVAESRAPQTPQGGSSPVG